MQNISSHIAYLLTQHERVIIPGLGAFVVSSSEKEKKSKWGILTPPENSLYFNSEINYSDELLANSIAKEKNCSTEYAFTLINDYVSNTLISLDEGKKVHIPFVGNLYSQDNEILFKPEGTLSCNALNYGLSRFSIPSLQDIQNESTVSPKKKSKKSTSSTAKHRIIAYAITIAVALIAVLMIPIPLNDGRIKPDDKQYVNIVESSEQDLFKEEVEAPETIIPEPLDTLKTIPEKPASQTEEKSQNNTAISNVTYYYIIVASLPDLASAKKTMAEIKSKGFKNADIISSSGKHRIYTSRFENKAEAERFLNKFRKDNPKYENAWLLTQSGS